MRNPNRKAVERRADEFIGGADGRDDRAPWEKGLPKKFDKDTGKVINVRLPEYYAACLEWLADNDNRSQHGELVHLLCEAIEQRIKP